MGKIAFGIMRVIVAPGGEEIARQAFNTNAFDRQTLAGHGCLSCYRTRDGSCFATPFRSIHRHKRRASQCPRCFVDARRNPSTPPRVSSLPKREAQLTTFLKICQILRILEVKIFPAIGPQRFFPILRDTMTTARRHFASTFGLVLVALILLPLVDFARTPPRDSFPFSFYPMFSTYLEDEVSINFVVATDGKKRERRVPPHLVTADGAPSMNLARKQIGRAVRLGGDELDELCRRSARRIHRQSISDRSWRRYRHVRIVGGHFSIERYFKDGEPLSEKVLASCAVR
ncbi:hypothetical protein K8I61_01570 [bacterium]|nr:hypothetical protein [bacterium]